MARCTSTKEVLEKLHQQLTCQLCVQRYADPKLLHCFHVFCENCLKPLACQTQHGQEIECPTCHQLTSLPQKGVQDLQGAFHIHHLLDIQDILKNAGTPSYTICAKCKKREYTCYCRYCGFICDSCKMPHLDWEEFSRHEILSLDQLVTEDMTSLIPPCKKVLHCSKHPAREVDLYCETCEEVICRDCILKVHHDHQYDLATEAFPKQQNVLITSVELAEQQLASVIEVLEELNTTHKKITDHQQVLETQIRASIRLIHNALETREDKLISQLRKMTQQKLKNVTTQQDQLEMVAARLKNGCIILKESLRTGSHAEILSMTSSFVQRVQNMTSTFKPESLICVEEVDLRFLHSVSEVVQICQQFGEVDVHNLCHAKCHAEGTGIYIAHTDEPATATVHIVDQKDRHYQHPLDMNCELVNSDGSSKIKGESKKLKDGQYEVTYSPQHKGQHCLHIQVEDKHISGSPFALSVFTTTPTKVIRDVSGPCGLTLDNHGQLLVAESEGHCISIFCNSGESKKSFNSLGSGAALQLKSPGGIALSVTGDILVCDKGNHRICIFSPNGKLVKCVGTKGNGPLQFEYPRSIAVHPHSNKIYVADRANHRIQILNEDFSFFSTFGSCGKNNGQFKSPRSIAFDSTGDVYVADTVNNRVQVFTANGRYIRQFGKNGNGIGSLKGPKGIALDSNDVVYVSECSNHRVSVYTQDGHFLTSFGTRGDKPGEFNYPTGLTVSKHGAIYISDYSNHRVQVF